MGSYSLEEFLGNGILKNLRARLAEDGWDDVPTLKVIAADDMDHLKLTLAQRDALELRIHLHNRSLMVYADAMEASGTALVNLINTKPADLVSKFRMRKTHVATFIDTSISCDLQIPPELRPRRGSTTPVTKPLPFHLHKSLVSDAGSSFGDSSRKEESLASTPRKSNASSMITAGYSSEPFEGARRSNAGYLSEPFEGARRSNAGYSSEPRRSNASSVGYENTSLSYEVLPKSPKRRSNASGYEVPSILRPLDATKPNAHKGVYSAGPAQRRLCGLLGAPKLENKVADVSVLERVLLRPLAPDHRSGIDSATLRSVRKLPPLKASSLWANNATLFFCIRRPGCVMCRAEAHQLYARKPIFDALGVQLVAIVLEDVDEEVWAFWPRYWAGMVVLDEKKDFFRALGGGKLMKENLLTGFVFNPAARRNWGRATRTGINYNNKGEGVIKGGLFIVRRGKGGVAYQFVERNFGDWAPLDEVLQVCHFLREEGDSNNS